MLGVATVIVAARVVVVVLVFVLFSVVKHFVTFVKHIFYNIAQNLLFMDEYVNTYQIFDRYLVIDYKKVVVRNI